MLLCLEAAEAMRCLMGGIPVSDRIKLNETLARVKTLDTIRSPVWSKYNNVYIKTAK